MHFFDLRLFLPWVIVYHQKNNVGEQFLGLYGLALGYKNGAFLLELVLQLLLIE